MKKSIAKRGEKFYDENLKEILEPEHFGEFIAIDPDSGRYFLGKTGGEAIREGEREFPDKILCPARVGYRAAYKFGGSSLRLFSRNKVNVLDKNKTHRQK